MFALIDCNNFYASCERKRNPSLIDKPIIVASGLQGAVIARSNETKKLGVKTGDPIFKIKDLIQKYNVAVIPADISYYVKISRQVMKCLDEFSAIVEIYSIDEAFVTISSYEKNYEQFSKKIIDKILTETQIPVSIGIAKTKVLCKIASKLAKKGSKYFVLDQDLLGRDEFGNILKNFECAEIWGIGYRTNIKLQVNYVYSAEDLRQMDLKLAQKIGGINLVRIIQELNEISVIEINEKFEARKMILFSRSFTEPIFEYEVLETKLAKFVSRAAEKLRSQNSLCGKISVYLSTSRFEKHEKYDGFEEAKIIPTDFTPELIKYSKHLLQTIYKSGFRYKKMGVVLTNFIDKNFEQVELFDNEKTLKLKNKKSNMMKAVDKINQKYGKNLVKSSAEIEKYKDTEANWNSQDPVNSYGDDNATIFDAKRFI